MARKKKTKSPMRKAINELYDLGYRGQWAPGDVLMTVAMKYEVDVSELEGRHIDEIESAAEEDLYWEPIQ